LRIAGPSGVTRLAVAVSASLAILSALAGCGLPTRAIPTERIVVGERSFVFGTALVAPDGAREDVLEIRRAGPKEDASILLRMRGPTLTAEVLEPGRRAARAPDPGELAEAAALLGPRSLPYRRTLGPWLEARTDRAALERAVALEARARRGAQDGLMGGLVDAFRSERAAVEAAERRAREESTVIAGLFGWQMGAYSGWSYSVPFHVERHDHGEGERDLLLIPLLSGGRCSHEGTDVLIGPLLALAGDVTTPLERTESFFLLGCGARTRVSAAGLETTSLALPLLAARRTITGEDFGATGGRLAPGRRASTHLLASLVAWSSETPGVYRDEGALKFVGRERTSWRVLPLASHESDDRSSETMLWPLLGFGWGEEDGKGYVRLFYFWKIGGG